MKTRRGGGARMALPLFLCLLAVSPPAVVHAQDKEPEMMLPRCGIMYPSGYDPNTVGVVEGRVTVFENPEQGPVSLLLDVAGETYTVLAAPSWYLEERKLVVKIGDLVRVKGSKTMGADGNLYLVVQEITPAGAKETIILRDQRGRPVWAGCGPRGCGRRGR